MIRYSDAIKVLVERFPCMNEAYLQTDKFYEGIPYVFYESEFTKYILNCLHLKQDANLSHIFDFVEELLTKGDEDIQNMVHIIVIEALYYETLSDSDYIYLSTFFKDQTKKSFQSYPFQIHL